MLELDAQSWWLSYFNTERPTAILSDLDGTLLPFASSPDEAKPSSELIALLTRLSSRSDLVVALVSGRRRDFLDTYFSDIPRLHLVAEHGVWHRASGDWATSLSMPVAATDALAAGLTRIASRFAGTLVERKTWSVALHFRRVEPALRSALLVEVAAFGGPWLAKHIDFEILSGEQVIEFRPKLARKSSAVRWLRDDLGFRGRCVALGDDLTDEDLFNALQDDDQAILVGSPTDRFTAASWQLPSPADAMAFLGALVDNIGRQRAMSATNWPKPMPGCKDPDGLVAQPMHDLLVISNRLPDLRGAAVGNSSRSQNVGGLVSALDPVLSERHGIWLGWNGKTHADEQCINFGHTISSQGGWAWVTLSEAWYRDYYKGFCNSTLWPLFHCFPNRVRCQRSEWESYCEVNGAFATAAHRIVGKDTTVWVHDYHLLLAGQYLRKAGHTGQIGLFLHIPFPPADIFWLIPWAKRILLAMLDFDVVGFHTADFAGNFLDCLRRLDEPVSIVNNLARLEGRSCLVAAFPLGIIPSSFQEPTQSCALNDIDKLTTALVGQKMILGVDRLDYTKGIPERIEAFGQLLQRYPTWRRNVALVQVSVPSRADIPEYEEQRARIEEIVGRINGEYGEADWVPIRYLYRSYGRIELQQLYRLADIGYVTPLRDGMNLVAKEFVAAQDPAHPGVLVLSRFAGAAAELDAAVLTNPWYAEGMADDLHMALSMEPIERRSRHERLLSKVQATTAITWAQDFLAALASAASH